MCALFSVSFSRFLWARIAKGDTVAIAVQCRGDWKNVQQWGMGSITAGMLIE